jgi:tetratricopeptide (TPR) repeat protein
MRRILALVVATILAPAAIAADRPWRVIRGRNVAVFGQMSPRTLREIALELEQFRVVLGNLVRGARQPQPLPTEVYIFDDYEAMKPFVPLYQGKPASLGGYCHCGGVDQASIIVAALSQYSDSSEIIYHEYSHLVLQNAMTTIPVWFNEGLGEYFSTFKLRGKEAEAGHPIARHIVLLRERFIPLTELLAVDHASPLYNEGTRRSIFYAESWALVHYVLLGRPDGIATINKYLTAYMAGTRSEDALAAAVGVPIKTLDGELRSYVQRLLFRAVKYTLSEPVQVDNPETDATIAPPDAAARLGEIQLQVSRVDEATRRIESAAAATPAAGRAQLALAKLRLRQHREAEAWPPLQRAAALSPDDFSAQYLYGLTLLRSGGNSSSNASDEWVQAARAALARAVAIHPDSAAAQAWFGYAGLQGKSNLEEARAATTKAIELAPGRLDYALQLGEIRIRMGDVVGARQLLTSVAKAGGDAREATRAARLLRMLDQRERLAADPRAAAASQGSARETATVGVALDDSVASARETLDSTRVVFQLRKVQVGEQRVFGVLATIECGAAGVRFRVRANGQDVAAAAKRLEDVDLIAYGNTQNSTISCGARVPPDVVYFTWTPSTAGGEGDAVAVEFMPKGYVP